MIARLVQDELGIGIAVGKVSPVEEEKLPKTCAFNSLEELLRNDLIRIDVRSFEWNDKAGMFNKWNHMSAGLSQALFSRRTYDELFELPFSHVREMTLDSGSSCHHGTDQVSPATATLPTFEVPV